MDWHSFASRVDPQDKGEGEEDEVPVQRKLPGAGVQIYGSHIAVSVGGLDDDADEEDEEEEPDA